MPGPIAAYMQVPSGSIKNMAWRSPNYDEKELAAYIVF